MDNVSERQAAMASINVLAEQVRKDSGRLRAASLRFRSRVMSKNAHLFIGVRWMGVIFFAVLALFAGIWSGHLSSLGISLNSGYLIKLCLAMGLANALFWLNLNTKKLASTSFVFWLQIIFDLVIVTSFVHYVGSVNTFAPFLYAIYIVIACVCFRRRTSFLVLSLCVSLYVGCVTMESCGYICFNTIFLQHSLTPLASRSFVFVNVVAGVAVWIGIWYLAGYILTIFRKHEADLAIANRQHEKTHALQQERLSHVSHQMKSPIHAIQSHIDLIVNGYVDKNVSAPLQRQLSKIDKRCKALSAFVGDMLGLAELQFSMENNQELAKFDLSARISQCVSSTESIAIKRGIRIEVAAEECIILGDQKAMDVFLDNLLMNAINYSHDDGLVSVGCKVNDNKDSVLLWVEDQGIGIPEDKLPNIFGEYYRTAEAKKHNPHSTGVGLAIAKQVAHAHGADMTVQSAPGEGTRFTISFPME